MTAANNEKWRKLCAEKGVLELYEYYLSCADIARGASVRFNTTMSVAIHNGKPPVISLHPKESTAEKGLCIYYSRTNVGRYLTQKSLPDDFMNAEFYQGNNEWRFGFFNSKEAIKSLIGEVFDA